MFKEIKYAYQRVRYGYDERIKWEFDTYFYQFIKPLKEFCEYELSEPEVKLNPKRYKVFTETLRLIGEIEKLSKSEEYVRCDQAQCDLWGYFGKNITIYWN